MNGFCLYLNRNFIQRAIESQKKDVYEVYTVSSETHYDFFE
jgi:hypothetical protein